MQYIKKLIFLTNCVIRNIPMLVGVRFEACPYLIVTTFHSISGNGESQSTTMHYALCHGLVDLTMHPHWIRLLHCLAMAVHYVHDKNIIHNDIMSTTLLLKNAKKISAQFWFTSGKATAANEGKTYPTFDEDTKRMYDEKQWGSVRIFWSRFKLSPC